MVPINDYCEALLRKAAAVRLPTLEVITKLLLRLTCLLPLIAGISLAQRALPPGSIDGSQHPEQIPDAVALRLFLGALSEPHSTASQAASGLSAPQPSARQMAKTRRVGLSVGDLATLFQTLHSWEGQAASLVSSSQIPSATSPTLDSIAQNTLNAPQAQMSPTGFAALVSYLQTEKKHMKIIPVPDMSPHQH